MRLIALGMTLVALTGAGIAGERFHVAWQSSQDGLDAQISSAESAPASASDRAVDPVEQVTMRWSPLFGEVQPPAPVEPVVVPENVPPPEPPQPPMPPLDTLGFTLKGVVRSGDAVWGLVSHPSGDRIVRVDEELAAGVMVHRINAAGLWVQRGNLEPELLGFERE